MLDKSISIDGQDNIVVNGTKDSTINISQTEKMINVTGNISVGMSYMDVKDLCQTLIRTEVNKLTQEAQEEFHKRLEEFERKFYEKLAKVESSNIEKLKKPSLQLCLYETILEKSKLEAIDFSSTVDYMVKRITEIVEKIGPRAPGSKEELAAQEFMGEDLKEWSDEITIEEFTVHRQAFMGFIPFCR